MNKILYIKASPRSGHSYSVAVADAFIETYHQTHPDDEINTIDIFKSDLPAFDFKAATAKYKIMYNQQHSEEDRQIWSGVVSAIEEFKSADKYVMAVPMWNFSIPYRLKQYIDILIQPTYTFSVTADGNYDKEAFDLQKRYLELILAFIGFSDIRSVTVEPTLAAGPDVAEQRRAKAIEKARQTAREF